MATHQTNLTPQPKQDSKSSTIKVPKREYGTRHNNPRLPSHLPIVGLGCSSFSSFFSSDNDDGALTVDTITKDHPVVRGWIETIRHAVLDRGINLLDTAPWYGHGTSEMVVGYALDTILSPDENNSNPGSPSRRKRTGLLPRSNLIINTKVGRYEADPLRQFDFSYSTTINSVSRSLTRLNISYIDILQLHDPEFAPTITILLEETIPALIECQKRGWTKAIGLTGYSLDVQHEILVKCSQRQDYCGLLSAMVFDQSLVYCHNNLHDGSLFDDDCFLSTTNATYTTNATTKSAAAASTKEKKVSFAQYCQDNQINVMCAAPLSMGLLTNSNPPDWHPAPIPLKEACAKAAVLCASNGVDISSLAMLYCLSQTKISCTLIGMKNVKEVDAAADLAVRFHSVDCNNNDSDEDSVLEQVLTTLENETLNQLLDPENGPFANVWRDGDYRWDGKAEAEKFWKLVDEMKNVE